MTGKEIATPAVPIEGPKLEAFHRHEDKLMTWEYEGTDENGRPVTRVYPLPEVNGYTDLILEAEAKAVIAELEAALVPAHYDQARRLARTVIGKYPKRELFDPDTFVLEMTRAFAEAPAIFGQQAVKALRSKPFLVNAADVMAALKPLITERTRALNQARRHLAEHQRRKAEQSGGTGRTEEQRRAYEAETEAIKRSGKPRPLGAVIKDMKG